MNIQLVTVLLEFMIDSDIQAMIPQLLKKFKDNPLELPKVLEKNISGVPENEKMDFFTKLGLHFYQNSHYKLAISLWTTSFGYYIGSDKKQKALNCILGISNAFNDLGTFEESRKFSEIAVTISEEIGDEEKMIESYLILGSSYSRLKLFEDARKYQMKAIKLSEKINDVKSKASGFLNYGATFMGTGEYKKAIEYNELAINLSNGEDKELNQILAYRNIGISYLHLGEFQKALEYFQSSLKLSKNKNSKNDTASALSAIGSIYYHLGEFKNNIKFQQDALKIFEKTENLEGMSTSFINLGASYQRLNENQIAMKFYEKGLEYSLNRSRKGEMDCYVGMGNIFSNTNNIEKSLEYQKKALEIAEELQDQSSMFRCFGNLGSNYVQTNNQEEAINFYLKAAKITESIGDEFHQSLTYYNIANIYEKSDPLSAYKFLKKSINKLENISMGFIGDDVKTSFRSSIHHIYSKMITLCLKLDKDYEAFEFLEISKSRALLDLIKTIQIKPTVIVNDSFQLLLNKEKEYLEKLRLLQMSHLDDENLNLTLGESQKITNELHNIYHEIEEFDPEYASLRKGKIISFDEINKFVNKNNCSIVEFFITSEKTHIFVISSNGLEVFDSNIDSTRIESFYDIMRDELKNKNPDLELISKIFDNLSNYLIKPIENCISKAKMIYFVPNSMLHYFPLHALKNKNKFLIEEFPIAYLPNLSTLQFVQHSGTGKVETCNAFGICLQQGEEIFLTEAQEIAEIFQNNSINNADVEKVLSNISADVLHFSCHGFFDSIDALSSGMILKGSNYMSKNKTHTFDIFSARDIFKLKINSELVTLSACETGLNETKDGDELIGFTRSLLYAGAASVLVSLWSVNAASTKDLMVEFYKNLKLGMTKAKALQNSMIKMIENKEHAEWRNPYYWAPFVLIGKLD